MVFGVWDIALLAAVSSMAVLTAYIKNPLRKTFMLMLPLPFTLAVLSLGKNIDATNVVALLILNLYYHLVRMLHYRFKLNILPAIGVGACVYIVLGAVLARLLPGTDPAFWISVCVVLGVSILLYRFLPEVDEPGYRTRLPLYIKLPLTAVIVLIIILIKNYLLGFMTLFPMVGVFATYETRKSLWTTCRQIPIVSLVMVLMLAIMRVSQDFFPVSITLMFGWAGLLAVLLPYFMKNMRAETKSPQRSPR